MSSLTSGLVSGLQGVLEGLCPTIGGPSVPAGYPQNQADLETVLGLSGALATSAWHFTATSGAESDLISSNDLAPVGTPTQTTGGVTFTDNSTDAMQASGAAVFDVTTGSFAVLMSFSGGAGSNLQLFGKRQSGSGFLGYELTRSGTSLFGNVTGSSSAASETASANHFDSVIHDMLWVYDVNADTWTIHTDLATSETNDPPSNHGSLTSTATFAFGAQRVNSVGYTLEYAAVFEGAAAEGLTATHLTNFRTHMER